RVGTHLRPISQGLENVSYGAAVVDLVEQRNAVRPVDAVMLLTIEAPFRRAFYVDKAIDVMRIFDVDAVVGVLPDNDLFFQHDGSPRTPCRATPARRRRGNGLPRRDAASRA